MRSPSGARLTALGLLAYCIFLVAKFPADTALAWFGPDGLQAASVQGTLWRGEAAAIEFNGTQLGKTTWILKPTRALLGRLQVELDTEYADGSLKAEVARPLIGKKIAISDMSGVLPLRVLGDFGVQVSNFDGRMGLQLERLILQDGWPSDIDGTIIIGDLKLRAPEQSLGSFEVTCASAEDGGVRGQFQDLDGMLTATGTLELTPERGYALNANVSPKPEAGRDIALALQTFGQRAADGSYQFSLSGTL